MKKFLSAFLMVCMLVTSLSVGVSADYAKDDDGNHVFTFNTANESARYYKIGNWKLSDGTNTVDLGTTTYNTELMGMTFKKVVLEEGTLTPANAATLSIRGDANKSVIEKDVDITHSWGDSEVLENYDMNAVLIPIDADGSGAIDSADAKSGKVIKYTMYAYSKLEDGEPLYVDYAITVDANTTLGLSSNDVYDLGHSNMAIPASRLYSADDIPHKIDFIVYYTGSRTDIYTRLRSGIYYEIYVDGLYYSGGPFLDDYDVKLKPRKGDEANSNRYSWVAPQIKISSDGTNAVKWKDTEMYICTNPTTQARPEVTTAGGKFLTLHAFSDIDTQLFQNIDFGKFKTTRDLRSDFVEGVNDELKSDLEALYTTATGGDRVVTVPVGTTPASIWTGDTSNVKLVKISDGTVYGVEDKENVTGTFEEYLISVNGVYTKVEFPVSYDAAAKTATVNVSKLPEGTTNMQVVVAAYNNDGAMEAIKVSESYKDFSSNIIYKINDTFPTDASKYKVFVFDSLTSAKPLMEFLEK